MFRMGYALDKAKILIVDDMKPMVAVTASVLKAFGFSQIFTAHNGEMGLEVAIRNDPDLIITDWMMEPIDGLEFIKNLRQHPASPNRFVPVIMMTGFSSRLRVETARDIGVTEFLVKPFTARDLYARITQTIEKPRKFVEAKGFFGPDRRRRLDTSSAIPRRREDDVFAIDMGDTDQEYMVGVLEKLRSDTEKI